MSARVDWIMRYRAVCSECGWWGEELESEQGATTDMDEHNAQEHDALEADHD